MRALPDLRVAFTWSHPGGRTGHDMGISICSFLGSAQLDLCMGGVEHGILDLNPTSQGNLGTVGALEISQLGVERGVRDLL